MTKKEKIAYQRKIDTIADGLLIDAYREAISETERIHRDVLLSLRGKINTYLAEHPEE